MGVSTDGQICFGIMFEEGFEFPWDSEESDDIEAWWRTTKGYQPPFEIWGKNGKLPGVTEAQTTEYYRHRREWLVANPIPVALVNYCSCEYPTYILAVPKTVIEASRGDPKEFRPSDLAVEPTVARALVEFCEEFGIELTPDQEPKWWLSSLWC